MNALNTIQTKGIKESSQKDIEKGQKILAAIYMVTNHLSETDAIRHTIRSTTASFVCASSQDVKVLLRQLEVLIGGAVFAGLMSEKNSSIIVYEMKRWVESVSGEEDGSSLTEFFHTQNKQESHPAHIVKDIKKTSSLGLVRSPQEAISSMSYRGKKAESFIDKNARQDTILSFINDRKSAVIKDIVSLFPDVSEKTIQRELNKLVENGKITKRGSKRWSVYMAVNSLL
jgi:hypothetical protein